MFTGPRACFNVENLTHLFSSTPWKKILSPYFVSAVLPIGRDGHKLAFARPVKNYLASFLIWPFNIGIETGQIYAK